MKKPDLVKVIHIAIGLPILLCGGTLCAIALWRDYRKDPKVFEDMVHSFLVD